MLRAPVVSRAEQKWRSVAPLLEFCGAMPARGKWLELGAAPGGMTRLLAQRGEVTALDIAPLHPDVQALPTVSAVCGDALVWRAGFGEHFDGLVCDMNGSWVLSHEAMVRQVGALAEQSPRRHRLAWERQRAFARVLAAFARLLGTPFDGELEQRAVDDLELLPVVRKARVEQGLLQRGRQVLFCLRRAIDAKQRFIRSRDASGYQNQTQGGQGSGETGGERHLQDLLKT